MSLTIDALLKPFKHFGVRLGLESSQQLLANLGNPHQQVPIIHVAGSNGKGSVCAYLSSIFIEAGYCTGRYTSPHLVDWTERICLNEKPISSDELEQILQQVIAAIQPDEPPPTLFEVLTASAWLYFAQQQVDIAVIEVGLGGRLDATNVCDRPLVSIITSISREHWQRLGPTLADIAWEKAGILKPNGSAVVGQLPPEAASVVHRRAVELGCTVVYPQPATDLANGWADYRGIEEYELEAEPADLGEPGILHILRSIRYPLPLQGAIQLHNSALAIAALQLLREQGWKISDEAIANGMAKTRWAGRLQWFEWHGHRILIDGAHNPASAAVLREFVDSLGGGEMGRWGDGEDEGDGGNEEISQSKIQNLESKIPSPLIIHWVIGMISTKDHADMFKALLREGDSLYLVPVPNHISADLEALATLAGEVCPGLASCQTYADVVLALEAATQTMRNGELTVLCGSLYLIGHFMEKVRYNPLAAIDR